MASILQAMKKADIQVYVAALLAYECALAPSEIIELQTSSFIRNGEDGTCMLSVPGKAKRFDSYTRRLDGRDRAFLFNGRILWR